MDSFGCRLVMVRCPKSGGDEDTAELGEHVGGRWLGLRGVPGRAGAVIGDAGGVVPGSGVPGGGDGLAGGLEWDGALDGVRGVGHDVDGPAGQHPAMASAMRRASHSREEELVPLMTSLASTGMATGLLTTGSFTTMPVTTQLLP